MASSRTRHRDMPCTGLRSEVQRAGKARLPRPALRGNGFGDFWRHKSHPPHPEGAEQDKDVGCRIYLGLDSRFRGNDGQGYGVPSAFPIPHPRARSPAGLRPAAGLRFPAQTAGLPALPAQALVAGEVVLRLTSSPIPPPPIERCGDRHEKSPASLRGFYSSDF